MRKVSIDEVPNSVQPAAVMRPLTEPLGATDLAINYYELEPGDSFAFAYHSHEIQEEIFYIQQGTATFETDNGPVKVEAGEIIRFGREEFQRGWNRSNERVRALALGSPLEYGEQVKLRHCPNCDEKTDNLLDRTADEREIVASCKRCGAETGKWHGGPMKGDVP